MGGTLILPTHLHHSPTTRCARCQSLPGPRPLSAARLQRWRRRWAVLSAHRHRVPRRPRSRQHAYFFLSSLADKVAGGAGVGSLIYRTLHDTNYSTHSTVSHATIFLEIAIEPRWAGLEYRNIFLQQITLRGTVLVGTCLQPADGPSHSRWRAA